jgi:hypothetical protein
MRKLRKPFRTPFGSALLGGAVVGLFGWAAIAAGWVEGGSTTTVAAPSVTPIAATPAGDSNIVNEIYRRDGQGVAFIRRSSPSKRPRPSIPSAAPRKAGRRPARASSSTAKATS